MKEAVFAFFITAGVLTALLLFVELTAELCRAAGHWWPGVITTSLLAAAIVLGVVHATKENPHD